MDNFLVDLDHIEIAADNIDCDEVCKQLQSFSWDKYDQYYLILPTHDHLSTKIYFVGPTMCDM